MDVSWTKVPDGNGGWTKQEPLREYIIRALADRYMSLREIEYHVRAQGYYTNSKNFVSTLNPCLRTGWKYFVRTNEGWTLTKKGRARLTNQKKG